MLLVAKAFKYNSTSILPSKLLPFMAEAEHQQHGGGGHHGQHFLIMAYGIQSHVNPCRVLAHRLSRLRVDGGSGPVRATLSLPVFTHRCMFPSSGDGEEEEEEEAAPEGVVSYAPYSDGLDDGTNPRDAEGRARSRRASSESLSAVVARLAARGRPVTCVVCSMMIPAALDVAREHGIPLAAFWIQPATVLAAYYHYFHGYGELVASHAADPAYEVSLPGRPLRIRDFPSFLVDTTGGEMAKIVNEAFRELFEHMDEQGQSTKVLVNTFDELEPAALAAMRQHLDVLSVGPVVGSPAEARIHLFDHAGADRERYMEWLGAQPARSVVYVSFGSICTYSKQQMEEIAHGLRRCARPFLLVVRKDGRQEDVSRFLDDGVVVHGQGMVVEWCDQPEVLSHPSVGCFVTHCGWNSTLEAVALGVPVVAAPGMFDQPTNAFLVEEQWGAGVRGVRNGEGVFAGEELARCVDVVMGGGARAGEIRERVEALKGMAREAAASGGPAERNLRSFVMSVQASDQVSTKDASKHVEIDVVHVENLVPSIQSMKV